MTKCNVVSWIRSWNRKRTLGTNEVSLNDLQTLSKSRASVLVNQV